MKCFSNETRGGDKKIDEVNTHGKFVLQPASRASDTARIFRQL
jgi:hypothetical protein